MPVSVENIFRIPLLYRCYGQLLRSQYNLIFKCFGKNDIENDIIIDLPFTFLMCNVTGRAMLADSTVMLFCLGEF